MRVSDPRNAAILKMFSMIDIGERAGSGIPGVVSVWEKTFGVAPVYIQRVSPDRTTTVLNVAELIDKNVGVNAPNNAINEPNNAPNSTNNAPNDPNNAPNNKCINDRQRTLLSLFAQNGKATLDALTKKLNVDRSTIKRDIAQLKQMGLLVREGGTRGIWIVK